MAIRSFLSLIHKISSRSATGVTLACCATCARCKTSSTIAPSSKNWFATAARTCFFSCCPSSCFVNRRCPSAGARSWNQTARSHSPASQPGTTLQKKTAFAFCTDLPSPEHDSQIGIPKTSATARFRTNKRLISFYGMKPLFVDNRHEQVVAGHLLWLRQSKQKQNRRRYIGQDSVFAAELCCVSGNVDEMNKVACMRGVG